MKKWILIAERYQKKNRQARRMKMLGRCMAILVVLLTIYTLTLPAITLARETTATTNTTTTDTDSGTEYPTVPHAAENTKIYLFDYGHLINDKITGQGMGLLPFYRLFPEYGYTVDGEAAWDHDTVGNAYYGKLDNYAPVINNTLVDGYPYISNGNEDANGSWLTQWGSLRYLFDPNYVAGNYWGKDYWVENIRKNTAFSNPYTADAVNPTGLAAHFRRAYLPVQNDDGSGTGLFQRDEDGYWYYDSGKNAAWYNPETEKFQLYNYTVIPGHEAFENYGGTTNGNFLPFNLGHVEGLTDYQTREKLVQNTTTGEVLWNNRVTANVGDVVDGYTLPHENFRLITSDRTNSVNLNFGMYIEFDFYMPKDGKIDGRAMEFVFKGDDDVWVFIDDVLVLDIGGCHGAESASINFATGELTQPGSAAGYHKPTTLKNAFSNAGITTGFDGDTFADYTVHTLKFFYMERGGNVSFCRLKFNMPQIQKNSISVTKELADPDGNEVDTLGNPDYYFAVMAQDGDNQSRRCFIGPETNGVKSVTGIIEYKVKNSDGSYVLGEDGKPKVFYVGAYGIFTLKAGQTAVFEGIPENAGKFYVQEMIKLQDRDQYSSFAVNGTDPLWNGQISWMGRTYFASEFDSTNPTKGPYGNVWYGVSSQITDASTSSSFFFQQQNRVDTGKLAKLSIMKAVQEAYTGSYKGETYKIYVALDGEPLPVGTTYTVGSETRTVGFDAAGNSYVELSNKETAVISNILSGTQFRVWESEDSAYGHTVTYTNRSKSGNGEDISIGTTGITGIVRVSDHVQFTVTNKQHSATLSIPVTKSFFSFDGGPYTYTFTLTEMFKNADGSWTAGDILATSEQSFYTSQEQTFNLADLSYLKHELDDLPTVKYYLIEETGEENPTLDNTKQFLVEVTISSQGDAGEITATISDVSWRASADGDWSATSDKKVVFVNTLAGDLKVTKSVIGSNSDKQNKEFRFTLTLETGASGTTLESFSAYKTAQDNTITTELITSSTYEFVLKDGEYIVFSGIPVGTKWKVTEEETEGFKPSWTIGGTSGKTASTSGNIVSAGTVVNYTNTTLYQLPSTGGAGPMQYTLIGGTLTIVSIACLLYIHFKRRREES